MIGNGATFEGRSRGIGSFGSEDHSNSHDNVRSDYDDSEEGSDNSDGNSGGSRAANSDNANDTDDSGDSRDSGDSDESRDSGDSHENVEMGDLGFDPDGYEEEEELGGGKRKVDDNGCTTVYDTRGGEYNPGPFYTQQNTCRVAIETPQKKDWSQDV